MRRTFAFDFEEVPVITNAFRRMVRELAFDISEMAMTTYLCARAHGKPFTAIPVFPMRAFHHGAIVYNTKSGIRTPKQLEGRNVGVNRGYTVTTGVWARSILQHEYGVDLNRVTWVLSGDEHVAEYRPPPNVVPIERGRTLPELVSSGEIAAAIGVAVQSPNVRPLILDAEQRLTAPANAALPDQPPVVVRTTCRGAPGSGDRAVRAVCRGKAARATSGGHAGSASASTESSSESSKRQAIRFPTASTNR